MHLGLIGGIGPAATEFYYRNLVKAHEAAGRVMDLVIVHAHLHTLAKNMSEGAAEAQAMEYRQLTERLAGAGCDAVAITSIGGHFCVAEFEAISPLPVMNIIPAIAADIDRRGLSRVGIIGTRGAMETSAYGALDAVDSVFPQGKDLDRTHDAYVAIAMSGQATADQRRQLFSVGRKLCEEQGAEAVLLGGTDLFLAFEGHDPGFEVIDGARVHCAALMEAMTR